MPRMGSSWKPVLVLLRVDSNVSCIQVCALNLPARCWTATERIGVGSKILNPKQPCRTLRRSGSGERRLSGVREDDAFEPGAGDWEGLGNEGLDALLPQVPEEPDQAQEEVQRRKSASSRPPGVPHG